VQITCPYLFAWGSSVISFDVKLSTELFEINKYIEKLNLLHPPSNFTCFINPVTNPTEKGLIFPQFVSIATSWILHLPVSGVKFQSRTKWILYSSSGCHNGNTYRIGKCDLQLLPLH